MCDRPIPQQNLCAELAGLVCVLPCDAVVPWLRGFWATMAREWTGIDVLRMEKFLLLVRRVLGASFQWMKSGSGNGSSSQKARPWDAERVSGVLGLLKEWPFAVEEEAQLEDSASDEQRALAPQTIPAGLKIHVLDIWVDEAEKVGMLDENDDEATRILSQVVGYVDILEQRTTSPGVRIRSKESLADDRLQGNDKGRRETTNSTTSGAKTEDDGDGGSWDGFDD